MAREVAVDDQGAILPFIFSLPAPLLITIFLFSSPPFFFFFLAVLEVDVFILTTMLRVADSYVSSLMVSEAETVYDFCWYPYMYASGEERLLHL